MCSMEADDLIETNGPLQNPSNSHVMLSNLTDEERCARISDVLNKTDVAHHLYDAYAAALTCHSPDDDDHKRITIIHDELQNAMKEVSNPELCSLQSCLKHKIDNNRRNSNSSKSQIKRNAAHLNVNGNDNDGFKKPSKKLTVKAAFGRGQYASMKGDEIKDFFASCGLRNQKRSACFLCEIKNISAWGLGPQEIIYDAQTSCFYFTQKAEDCEPAESIDDLQNNTQHTILTRKNHEQHFTKVIDEFCLEHPNATEAPEFRM
ncbi:hypothetical protein CDAR_265231 [Caerostris darwini]|uniref:Uncharacterized protein n=1 Tax=Caerostris darwini TaxID=1538125 RepID=A0AAV4W3I5_9ARAC|nr:hypothetical protein CDAR_265231 [Caerostris darwini]